MEKSVYKLFPFTPNPTDKKSIFRLTEGENIEDYSDCVIMNGKAFREIFGKTKSESSTESKLLSVVKISFNGKNIHRRYRYIKGMNEDSLALTCDSLKFLDSDIKKIKNVTVSRGSCLKYFWYHPFHATRITMRLGLPALILSLLSLVLSIIALL